MKRYIDYLIFMLKRQLIFGLGEILIVAIFRVIMRFQV